MVRYDMIWYDMIWCDMIWYDMIRCDVIRYDMIWYYIRYDVILYMIIIAWYDIWYDTIRYDMIWYDMIWYDMLRNGMPIIWRGSPRCAIISPVTHDTNVLDGNLGSLPTYAAPLVVQLRQRWGLQTETHAIQKAKNNRGASWLTATSRRLVKQKKKS